MPATIKRSTYASQKDTKHKNRIQGSPRETIPRSRILQKSICVLPGLELLPRESVLGVSGFLESENKRNRLELILQLDIMRCKMTLTSSAFFPVSWNVTFRQVKSSRGLMPIKLAAVSISNSISRSIFSSDTKS